MAQENETIARIKSSYMKQYEVHKERQRKRKKRLYRRLSVFGFVVIILFGSLSIYHFNQRSIYAEQQEQYEQLSEQLADLKRQENNLEEEINLLNDEEYILDIARTNYFLSKKDELIFQIEDDNHAY